MTARDSQPASSTAPELDQPLPPDDTNTPCSYIFAEPHCNHSCPIHTPGQTTEEDDWSKLKRQALDDFNQLPEVRHPLLALLFCVVVSYLIYKTFQLVHDGLRSESEWTANSRQSNPNVVTLRRIEKTVTIQLMSGCPCSDGEPLETWFVVTSALTVENYWPEPTDCSSATTKIPARDEGGRAEL